MGQVRMRVWVRMLKRDSDFLLGYHKFTAIVIVRDISGNIRISSTRARASRENKAHALTHARAFNTEGSGTL